MIFSKLVNSIEYQVSSIKNKRGEAHSGEKVALIAVKEADT